MADARRPLLSDPVFLPGTTARGMTERICGIVLREQAYRWWWFAMLPALGLTAMGMASVGWLFIKGVDVWGIDWPVMWGFAIINYVWWIGIASGGTLISSLFFLVRAEWRTSVNRLAESMTLFAAACAGVYPILHLGRPWFFYWLFPYPNTMAYWPNWRSPLLWDFFAILTYVSASVLFWFLGAVPDFATLRDQASGGGASEGGARGSVRSMVYGVLAMGFRGSGAQWRHYRAAYGVLAAIMLPLVCSVHSIVGLDFAGAATVGWHSTQYPPFFVFGAALSGFATVLLLVLPLRRALGLQSLLTGRHVDVLCRLLLTSSLLLGYAYVMDAFGVFYGADPAERTMFAARIGGDYAFAYWGAMLFNVVLPQLFWFRRLRMVQPLVLLVSLGVIVGMWLERYEIVVTSLRRSQLASAWGNYHGTIWDWTLLLGTVGLFCTGLLLVVRLVPIVSMFEMRGLLGRARDA